MNHRSAALVAAIVPAAVLGLPGVLQAASEPGIGIPTRVLPEGAGLAAGSWRLPGQGSGSATLDLFGESGNLMYVVRASLLRSGEFPPEGMPEQGGFLGTLILVEADGSRSAVAEVAGKWVRESNGTGTFGADIRVRTERLDEPYMTIGAIEGVLRAPVASGGATGSQGVAAQQVASLARLSGTWFLGQ